MWNIFQPNYKKTMAIIFSNKILKNESQIVSDCNRMIRHYNIINKVIASWRIIIDIGNIIMGTSTL